MPSEKPEPSETMTTFYSAELALAKMAMLEDVADCDEDDED